MARTVEVRDPQVHFVPTGQTTTVSDGGDTLTAAVGRRSGSADGLGMLVFFFHGTKFVGWDADTEVLQITRVARGKESTFDVTYLHHAPNDPACCPSLPPVTIGYAWTDGEGFVGDTPPANPQGPKRPDTGPTPDKVRLS